MILRMQVRVGGGRPGAGVGLGWLGSIRSAGPTSVSQPSCGMYAGTGSPVAREVRGRRAWRKPARSRATRRASSRSSRVYSVARSAHLVRAGSGRK